MTSREPPGRIHERLVGQPMVTQPRTSQNPETVFAKSFTALPQLLELVGRMRVGDFARLAGVSVETLASQVIGASSTLGNSTHQVAEANRSGESLEPTVESTITGLAGRATLREVKVILDRWLLGMVLEEHGGNITRSAARLGLSRRVVRERWATVRDVSGPLPPREQRTTVPSAAPFPLPSLTALVARGGTYEDVHETVARWLVACVLDQKGGNVTHTARALGVSRRFVRELRDESKASRESTPEGHTVERTRPRAVV